MKKTTLPDGTEVWCLRRAEALVLDHHVRGYLEHGIEIRPGDVVFDVGGNIGLFGVRALQSTAGDVTVHAFEPIPPTFAVLQKNFAQAPERLVAHNCGISDAPGQARFSYFPNAPALSTAHPEMWEDDPESLNAAVRGNIENAPPEMWYARWVPRFLTGLLTRHIQSRPEQFDCQLRTISQVMAEHDLERIDLLKIDIEGGELAALMGISDADWPKVGKVVCEVHDKDGRLDTVCALLQKHGLSEITCEKEKGFEHTALTNVFARRP